MKYLLLFLFISISFSCNNPNPKNDIFEDWKIDNIQEIKSLELDANPIEINSLSSIVGDAEIVCIGESRHDIHEQFKLKLRFVKYLIEKLGFTTFALEASLPYSNRLNDYILHGTGDLEQLMSNMPGWFLWDTEELKELFIWLKEHNQDAKNKVNFYGFDIVAPNDAITQIFEYLKVVDSKYYQEIQIVDFARDVINDNHWPSSLQQYSNISVERKTNLNENFEKLFQDIESQKEDYVNISTQEEYDWILKLAYSAKEANHMFSKEDRVHMGLIRDNAMANISSWIKTQNSKTIIWAHNVHIAKSNFTMSMFPSLKIKGMGSILFDKFQDKMISIGASFGTGEFKQEHRTFEQPQENSIDRVLSELKLDYLIVDLRKESTDEKLITWLNKENVIRGQEFIMECVPIKSFDALYYTDKISKVKYNPQTQSRLNN